MTNKPVNYRLALFNPCDDREPLEFIGPIFGDDDFDRSVMNHAIQAFNAATGCRRDSEYCLAVFPLPGFTLRVALMHPKTGDLIEAGAEFDNTPGDWLALADAIRRLTEQAWWQAGKIQMVITVNHKP